MSTIGTLTKRPDGSFVGELAMKSYAGRTLFQPAGPKATDAAPDYRIYGAGDRGGRFEMGAAWIKTRNDGSGTYVSVKIDYPELPAPVYATLGVMAGQDDEDVFAVIWNRPAEGRTSGADPFAGLSPRSAGVVEPFDPLERPETAPATRKGRGRTAGAQTATMPDDDLPV